MDKEQRQSHLEWQDQERISDLVFQSTGRHVHGLDRVFLPSAKFLSAVANAGDRLLFYGVVQFTQLAVLAEIWLFDDKVSIVKITAGDVFPSGAKMLFNSVSQVRAGAAGFGAITDILAEETVTGWRIFGDVRDGAAGDEYHLIQYPDPAVDGEESAFSGSIYSEELMPTLSGPLIIANAALKQVLAIANFDYSNPRFLWPDSDALDKVFDIRSMVAAGGSVRVMLVSDGGITHQVSRFFMVEANDHSFELTSEYVKLIQGEWAVPFPANYFIVEGAQYRIFTNKTEGSVKIMVKYSGEVEATDIYPDLVVPILGGNVAFTPIQADIDSNAAGEHYVLRYIPPASALSRSILIKNKEASAVLTYSHNGQEGTLAGGASVSINMVAGVPMVTSYSGGAHRRNKYINDTMYQSYYTTGSETFDDFASFNRIQYHTMAIGPTTW